jgi:hypothetical protein
MVVSPFRSVPLYHAARLGPDARICRAIRLTARALALYHDFDARHMPLEPRDSLPLLCALWRAGAANLDFANAGNRAHRQALTVGFLFCAAEHSEAAGQH